LTVGDEDDLLILTQEAMVLRISSATFRVLGRSTSGVKVIRFKRDNDKIISIVPLALADEAEEVEIQADGNSETEQPETTQEQSEPNSNEENNQ